MQKEMKPIDAINAFIEEMGRDYLVEKPLDAMMRVAIYFTISPGQAQKAINNFLNR